MRVIIVSEFFPPDPSVGGLRPGLFAKYLPKYGWDVEVVTTIRERFKNNLRQYDISGLPDDKLIHRIPFDIGEHLRNSSQRSLLQRLWHIYAIDEAQYTTGLAMLMRDMLFRVIESSRPDIIWATAPSLAPLRAARDVAKLYNLPWIADFRDLDEVGLGGSQSLRSWLRRCRSIHRRKHLINSATGLIAVTKGIRSILNNKYSKPIDVIYNGFDDEHFHFTSTINAQNRSNVFILMYSGGISDTWYRNPEPLFQAIDIMSGYGITNCDFRLILLGTEPDIVKQLVPPDRPCNKLIELTPPVLYSHIPEMLAKAACCLLLANPTCKGVLTTKVFEYLAMRKPILCVPGDNGELDSLISESGCGKSEGDPERIASLLMDWIEQWKRYGYVSVSPRDSFIKGFSRRNQAEQLANLLKQAVQSHLHFCPN